MPLELVWFDDHRGTMIRRDLVEGPAVAKDVPNTEAGGFGRSVAFVIQPVGYTPDKCFAPLPNELIGQILIDTIPGGDINLPATWDEERAEVLAGECTFVAKTRPAIAPTNYKFTWRWFRWKETEPGAGDWHWDPDGEVVVDGQDHVTKNLTIPEEMFDCWYRVEVDIEDKLQGDRRVSGDQVHVHVQ